MKDFELQLRLRNNQLKARRKKLGWTVPQLAEASGASASSISAYENMRMYPLIKSRIGKTWSKTPNTWRSTATKLAIFFECPCEELWPDAVLRVKKPVVTTEVDAKQLALLSGFEKGRLLEATPTPEETTEAVELFEAVDGVLGTLTPREEQVLRLRFGLCEEGDHTLPETGEIVGSMRGGPLSHERARQIESAALRKLRHPSRSKFLKPFVQPECVGDTKLGGRKCAKCGSIFLLKDTKSWQVPLCYDCWVLMDRPKAETEVYRAWCW